MLLIVVCHNIIGISCILFIKVGCLIELLMYVVIFLCESGFDVFSSRSVNGVLKVAAL